MAIPCVHVAAIRVLRVRLRKEDRARTKMIAADLLRRGTAPQDPAVCVADDGQGDHGTVGGARVLVGDRSKVATGGGRRPQVPPLRQSPSSPPHRGRSRCTPAGGLPFRGLRVNGGAPAAMASSNGSATVAPRPRRASRRDRCFRDRNTRAAYFLKSASLSSRRSAVHWADCDRELWKPTARRDLRAGPVFEQLAHRGDDDPVVGSLAFSTSPESVESVPSTNSPVKGALRRASRSCCVGSAIAR